MACCTYLLDHDYTKPTSDGELNDLLAEVRKVTGEDWRIREFVSERRRWFRRPVIAKAYELLVGIHSGEFQIVNFYRPEADRLAYGSMNFINDAGYVAAYLYGVLAGAGVKVSA